MNKKIILLAFAGIQTFCYAQNVGIGTTTPGFPLNFSNGLGDKISLYGNSGFHYGFGIQGGLLQIHSDAAAANIAFGYGNSSNFTERMRIINSGLEGMTLDGRLTIRNGQPTNAGGGGGVWLTKPDNTALLGFMGTQNSQNIGFYGGPGGWGFTYDAINSRVGIGNNNPNAPLAFAASLGKKITLYPGTLGDAGFGMAGNRLQIYSDNPNADVAIGYDAAGIFNEKLAVKPTGALAVSGNVGNTGEVLTSNGGNAAAWSPGTNFIYNNSYKKSSLSFSDIGGAGNPSSVIVPDLAQTISVTRKVMAMISWNYSARTNTCAFCGNITLFTTIRLNGNWVHQLNESIANGLTSIQSGTIILFLDPGTYTVDVQASNFSSSISVSTGGNNTGIISSLNIVLFPQ